MQYQRPSNVSKHTPPLSMPSFPAFFLPTVTFLGEEVYCFQLILCVSLMFAFILFKFKQPNHEKQNRELDWKTLRNFRSNFLM